MSVNSRKSLKRKIKYWLLPETNEKIDSEINENNINNLHNLSLAIAVIQTISLIIFLPLQIGKSKPGAFTSAVHVFLCVVICAVIFALTSVMIKKNSFSNNRYINTFIVVFIAMIIIWSEFVSIKHYISNFQMLTFFTAELCVVLFIKLKPVISIAVVTLSSASFYIYLYFFVKGQPINLYNYAMFFLILIAGATQSYRYTVNNIKQRNQINLFNNNLQIIANHDITTRLRNRYSLGLKIGETIDKEICIAMIDINKFKSINDTYGHLFGDEVLKIVADKMVEIFDGDNVFRYGGDEFLVVEEEKDLEQFKDKFRRLNMKLRNSRVNDTEITIQCCFGCVKSTVRKSKDFSELILLADKKLYDEKHKD